MAIRTDPALQYMPQRLQDEFRDEVSRAGRRGPISDAVLPLNSALLDRQARIDALTVERDRLRAELAELRRDAARIDWLALAGDVSLGIIIDAPGDGQFAVHHDFGTSGLGKTLREAIDAAMTEKAP